MDLLLYILAGIGFLNLIFLAIFVAIIIRASVSEERKGKEHDRDRNCYKDGES